MLECYQGVSDEEVVTALQSAFPASRWFFSADAMKSPEQIDAILKQDITEDEIFGYMTRQNMDCYFDGDKLPGIRSEIAAVTEGIVFVYGVGAAYVQPSYDLLVYADMARWEIQMLSVATRYRMSASAIGKNVLHCNTSVPFCRLAYL